MQVRQKVCDCVQGTAHGSTRSSIQIVHVTFSRSPALASFAAEDVEGGTGGDEEELEEEEEEEEEEDEEEEASASADALCFFVATTSTSSGLPSFSSSPLLLRFCAGSAMSSANSWVESAEFNDFEEDGEDTEGRSTYSNSSPHPTVDCVAPVLEAGHRSRSPGRGFEVLGG